MLVFSFKCEQGQRGHIKTDFKLELMDEYELWMGILYENL